MLLKPYHFQLEGCEFESSKKQKGWDLPEEAKKGKGFDLFIAFYVFSLKEVSKSIFYLSKHYEIFKNIFYFKIFEIRQFKESLKKINKLRYKKS